MTCPRNRYHLLSRNCGQLKPGHDRPRNWWPVFQSYLGGLQDSGWEGREDRVRLVYLTVLGTCEAARTIQLVVHAALDPQTRSFIEAVLAGPLQDVLIQWAEAERFFLRHADEALELAQKVVLRPTTFPRQSKP